MHDEGKDQSEPGWVFKSAQAPAPSASSGRYSPQPRNNQAPGAVSWSASEYVAQPKNTAWFTSLAAASVALAVLVYFVTSDVVSTVVIVVLGIIVGVFAARQPRVLQYGLDTRGVHMGTRFYPYGSFKSFSVVAEGPFNHVSLTPLKRFMPALAVHYAPDDEEAILSTLANYLPYEEHKNDLIENFSRRIRF